MSSALASKLVARVLRATVLEPDQKKNISDSPPGGPSRSFALGFRHWLPVREVLEALALAIPANILIHAHT